MGATFDGDLQVAWLRADGAGAERPVFLDSRLEPGGAHGLCAFYVLDDDFRKVYVSRKFRANPALFVADGDPFEPATQVTALFIDGLMIPLVSRQTELYDEYLRRSPGLQVDVRGAAGE